MPFLRTALLTLVATVEALTLLAFIATVLVWVA